MMKKYTWSAYVNKFMRFRELPITPEAEGRKMMRDSIASAITEGRMVKGGTNPPNDSDSRPLPPGGSDGRQLRKKRNV